MPRYKIIDGVKIQFTEEEEKAADTLEKSWTDGAADRDLAALRLERNGKLVESDWMANSDVTMSDAWKKYRQELRDITKTYKSLEDVKWPTAPKG
tara:strand:- start:181 stop:465 length:285 start_codon:yes stop_codon:yes gene_type:complete